MTDYTDLARRLLRHSHMIDLELLMGIAPPWQSEVHNDLRRAADLLEEMGQQEPVATLHDDGYWTWNGTPPHESNYAGWRLKVYYTTQPAQPQAWHPGHNLIDGSDEAEAALDRLAGNAQPQERSCTCHPDDNPPVPCAQRYALDECRKAAQPQEQREPKSEPTEAQITDASRAWRIR